VIINDLRAQSTNGFARAAPIIKTGGTLDNKRQARIGNDTLRISWYLTTTLVSTTNNLARG
jgi:hypothetical protein